MHCRHQWQQLWVKQQQGIPPTCVFTITLARHFLKPYHAWPAPGCCCARQNPSLLLAPHVAAPGAFIPVVTMHGSSYRASGTSFASPYIAGVLALWLQAQQQQAARSGRPLAAAEASQAAALRRLVSTAKGVRSDGNSSFLEPVAKLGAGAVQEYCCCYWHGLVLMFTLVATCCHQDDNSSFLEPVAKLGGGGWWRSVHVCSQHA